MCHTVYSLQFSRLQSFALWLKIHTHKFSMWKSVRFGLVEFENFVWSSLSIWKYVIVSQGPGLACKKTEKPDANGEKTGEKRKSQKLPNFRTKKKIFSPDFSVFRYPKIEKKKLCISVHHLLRTVNNVPVPYTQLQLPTRDLVNMHAAPITWTITNNKH